MSAIPSINERAAQPPSYIDQASALTKGQGLNETSSEIVRDVLTLLGSEASVRVTNKSSAATTQETGSATGATGIPALDNPADPEAVRADLEKLIAYLKLENDEKQAEMAKDRIEIQKGEIEQRHGDQVEKLKKSLKEMDKAAKASLLTKIFGWLMAALAVVLAVVASVATGGVAIGAVVGAVVALGMAIANETGAMEKLTEKLADALKDAGLSKMAAEILAAVIIGLATIVLSVGAGAGGAAIGNVSIAAVNAATKSIQTAAETMKLAMQIGMGVLGLVSTGAGIGASVQGYKAGLAQAEVSEMEKFLVMMQQKLEESQEELNEILEAIQNSISNIIAILDSETDTQKEIAQQMGAMA